MAVEPVPDAPAALLDVPAGRALLVADVHAGIETGLRRDGVELDSRGSERRKAIRSLLETTGADRLIVLGDFGHAIGAGGRIERDEIADLVDAITERVALTVVKGNHDGEIETVLENRPAVTITGTEGVRLGDVGLAHGHTWPAIDVLRAETICVGHEHPVVRLEDTVGGVRHERVWLRGPIDPVPFREYYGTDCPAIDGELVVCPAFNELSGGTWVNVAGQSFLAPFLPAALGHADAYLLDGTRLGPYDRV